MVFYHKNEESDVAFLIRVPIQFKICQITTFMVTLRIKICVYVTNYLKTDSSLTIFIIFLAGKKLIVYMRR